VQQSRRLDAMILAVLIGGTLLIGAVIAKFILDWGERADLIAAIAAILLGAPIVYGAAKSLITGRCSHDDGEACGHEHQHHSGSHMEELVALAVMASFANGEYIECGAVAFFMLIASFIEHRTAAGAQEMIESLVRITPTKARKLTDQGEVETAAHDLRPGDRIIVRPGDAVAADGLIRQGASTLNQANITGESLPVEKTEGDEVFAGTINETGVLTVEVSRAGEDSTLGRVQELILQAAASRPAVMRMLEKYASYYTPVVLMVAAILWFFTQDLDASISLLLIACPCAIILAAPTAMVAGLSAAARLGLYVKNVGDLEVARRINAIVLDKTGTLTLGELSVARLAPLDGVEPAELLRAAAAIEHQSRHPVAKAVARTAQKARLQLPEVTGFEEVAGRGVRGIVNGDEILVGRESWIQEQGVDTASLDLSSGEGMSLLVVARNGQPQGWIGLEDRVRAGAKDAMDQLEELGIKRRVMITGDRQSPAKKVAAQLHITDVQAEALPGDKLLLVRQLREKGHTVAVVGDGVNDAPSPSPWAPPAPTSPSSRPPSH